MIGPQNIGRLPVVKALTVNVHLISREFIHTEVVCCYLQPKPQSKTVPPGQATVEVEVIAAIMWCITETHYSVLKLEQRPTDMQHSTHKVDRWPQSRTGVLGSVCNSVLESRFRRLQFLIMFGRSSTWCLDLYSVSREV